MMEAVGEIGPAVDVPKPASREPIPQVYSKPDLTVSIITWSPSGARALINGRIFRKGDVVEGMMIVEISKNSVTLKGNGRTLTLEVGS